MVVGTVRDDVAALEFRLSTGERVRGEVIEAPDALDSPEDHFIAFLPPSEEARIAAISAAGEVLQVRLLTGRG